MKVEEKSLKEFVEEKGFDRIFLLTEKGKLMRPREFVKKLVSMIPKDQMISMLENIEDYIQDSSLYLRFSKQHFVKKTLILEEKDPLKIIVYTPVYVRKEIIDAYKNLLEIK